MSGAPETVRADTRGAYWRAVADALEQRDMPAVEALMRAFAVHDPHGASDLYDVLRLGSDLAARSKP